MVFDKERELEEKKIRDIKNGTFEKDTEDEKGQQKKDSEKSVMYYG